MADNPITVYGPVRRVGDVMVRVLDDYASAMDRSEVPMMDGPDALRYVAEHGGRPLLQFGDIMGKILRDYALMMEGGEIPMMPGIPALYYVASLIEAFQSHMPKPTYR